MTPKYKLFQAGFSAAFAIALVVLASPAHAETLALACEGGQGGSLELLVDFDRKTVQRVPASSCTWEINGRDLVVPDCYPTGRAEITEHTIGWETVRKNVSGTGVISPAKVSGSLNRTTGSAYVQETGPSGIAFTTFQGKCRRATKKF